MDAIERLNSAWDSASSALYARVVAAEVAGYSRSLVGSLVASSLLNSTQFLRYTKRKSNKKPTGILQNRAAFCLTAGFNEYMFY